jgi:cytochrome c oxidase subunit IV
MTENNHQHITPYRTYGIILVTLLFMTFISVFAVHLDLGAWSVGLALLIASVKGTLVLMYFMHLKFDHPVFRIMFIGVILLFASFIILTFVDYLFR